MMSEFSRYENLGDKKLYTTKRPIDANGLILNHKLPTSELTKVCVNMDAAEIERFKAWYKETFNV